LEKYLKIIILFAYNFMIFATDANLLFYFFVILGNKSDESVDKETSPK